MSLPEALEAAADALRGDADAIRPANGDPVRLLSSLDPDAAARVLGWVLVHRPEDGAELADAWGSEASGREILAIQCVQVLLQHVWSRSIRLVRPGPLQERHRRRRT